MTSTSNRSSQALVLTAIIALSLNLRPAVNGLGSLVPEIRVALNLSGAASGALTALPVVCFAFLGLIAPSLASKWGPHKVIVGAISAMVIGQLVRSLIPQTFFLFLGSFIALAGLALTNVLMPGMVRRHFPDRIPTITAVYTTCLAIGAASSSAFTPTLEKALGGDWQLGLGMWAVVAVIALIPWLFLVFGSTLPTTTVHPTKVPLQRLTRSPLAWGMAFYFGLQSMQAYVLIGWLSQILVDEGMTIERAGFMLGIYAAVGIPLSAALPLLLRRKGSIPVLVVSFAVSFIIAYTGLLVAPADVAWLWALLLGFGSGSFPLALTLVALRARTPDGVVALSAFSQCVGYLMAGLGPITFGVLHDITGSWTVPIVTMMVVVGITAGCGLYVARPKMLEDQLGL
ncbi:MFS transporter [Nakamurella antarctica]|uniref:MFS transporter n=1 Tax=Nakamurella antarctica TaxID=1902245 RepID=A0A3G8ZYX7_9ACTN|nr:MFS transporter [Nakamurella antarctica]AZI58771.1 MFS transporter [Nakamurella antarctica]